MNMSINFDVKTHWSWFKHQDLRHTNAENGAFFKMNHTLSP